MIRRIFLAVATLLTWLPATAQANCDLPNPYDALSCRINVSDFLPPPIQPPAVWEDTKLEPETPASRTVACELTAYYQAVAGQPRYSWNGSRFRTFAEEVKMNGDGHAADGTPVYVGMVAAPKHIAFGTRVEIPGYGEGVVHDRGGAITQNGTVTRFDVWMGRGFDALLRAEKFGRKKGMTCTVFDA